MSQSSWPPELKTWVQNCLSRATSSNKDAINAELKQILFKAHAEGTINSTNWPQMELEALKSQSQRTAFTPQTIQSISKTTTANTPKDSSKKKKKKNDGTAASSFPSPYLFTSTAQEEEAKARRAARFQKPIPQTASVSNLASTGGLGAWFVDEEGGSGGLGMIPGQVGKRKMTNKAGLGYGAEDVQEVDPNVIDWDRFTIRGTSTKLEKPYLRLTSEPSPADIRPLPILEQTLELLKSKWKKEHNYAYAVDQFKSMRQDLTVQRIKNDFTVKVYEIHARIALEAKDLGEYNQCQTMLRQLYELGLHGHPHEFLSYRIMYLLHTRNSSDMAALLAQLTEAEKSQLAVKHALDVHAALATSNYHRFFRLFLVAPNMSGYIMDHFVERERISALAVIYMTLPLTYIFGELAFDSEEHTHQFLADHDAAIYTPLPMLQGARLPLRDLIWDCKKAHQACQKGIEKYRVVDLKGQVD
nr:nuclear protein [Cryptococcus depauperatus CBS 7841]